MKMRYRPNIMTRNLEKKKIIELSKLMRGDTRISTPTNLCHQGEGSLCKGTQAVVPKVYQEATTLGVMTYSSPLIQLFTNLMLESLE